MIYSQGISPLSMYNPQAELPESASARKSRMREICSEFEGAMTAAMFKEGLRSAVRSADDEDQSGGTQAYMEMAMDQLAFHLGKQGMLGLADMLVDSLSPTDTTGSATDGNADPSAAK